MKLMEKFRGLLASARGESMGDFAIGGIVAFIIIGVLLYIMFPVLSGVQSATPTISVATPLGLAQNTTITGVASGTTLLSIVMIVIAAVVILGVLIYGLTRSKPNV